MEKEQKPEVEVPAPKSNASVSTDALESGHVAQKKARFSRVKLQAFENPGPPKMPSTNPKTEAKVEPESEATVPIPSATTRPKARFTLAELKALQNPGLPKGTIEPLEKSALPCHPRDEVRARPLTPTVH